MELSADLRREIVCEWCSPLERLFLVHLKTLYPFVMDLALEDWVEILPSNRHDRAPLPLAKHFHIVYRWLTFTHSLPSFFRPYIERLTFWKSENIPPLPQLRQLYLKWDEWEIPLPVEKRMATKTPFPHLKSLVVCDSIVHWHGLESLLPRLRQVYWAYPANLTPSMTTEWRSVDYRCAIGYPWLRSQVTSLYIPPGMDDADMERLFTHYPNVVEWILHPKCLTFFRGRSLPPNPAITRLTLRNQCRTHSCRLGISTFEPICMAWLSTVLPNLTQLTIATSLPLFDIPPNLTIQQIPSPREGHVISSPKEDRLIIRAFPPLPPTLICLAQEVEVFNADETSCAWLRQLPHLTKVFVFDSGSYNHLLRLEVCVERVR